MPAGVVNEWAPHEWQQLCQAACLDSWKRLDGCASHVDTNLVAKGGPMCRWIARAPSRHSVLQALELRRPASFPEYAYLTHAPCTPAVDMQGCTQSCCGAGDRGSPALAPRLLTRVPGQSQPSGYELLLQKTHLLLPASGSGAPRPAAAELRPCRQRSGSTVDGCRMQRGSVLCPELFRGCLLPTIAQGC